ALACLWPMFWADVFRPMSSDSWAEPLLRAGMPPAVIAEIGARGRVPRPVAPRAIARIATTARHYCDFGTRVVVIVRRIVIGPVVIVVRPAVEGERADRAGEEAAAMVEAVAIKIMATPAAVPGGSPAGKGAASGGRRKARTRRAAASEGA